MKTTVIILAFLSGASDGLNQTLNYHYPAFEAKHPNANAQYWNPQLSWTNKYRNYPEDSRAAFPLSKTALVWATDAHHLTRTLDRGFLVASLTINFSQPKKKWYWYPMEAAGIMLVRSIGFHAVYTVIY